MRGGGRLDRYLARQFLLTFLVLVMGLPFFFVLVDITENLDQHLARGLSLARIAHSYLYHLPQFVLWSMPIAALVATVFTIGGMTRHNEVVAAKAGGVSFYRLIAPLVVLGVALSGVALALSEVVPVTNRIRAELVGDRAVFLGGNRANFVYRTESGKTLSVQRLDARGGLMTGVVFERPGEANGGAVHGTAREAIWSAQDGSWNLLDGYVRYLTGEGEETTVEFSSLRLPGLRESPDELLATEKEADEMRYAEVSRFIEAIERSGGDSGALRTERVQKISLPLAVVVIVLFGAPLATSSRRGGAAYGIGVSLAVTMAYLLLFRVGSAMGAAGAVSPLVAGWLPNVLFLAAGLLLLARVRT